MKEFNYIATAIIYSTIGFIFGCLFTVYLFYKLYKNMGTIEYEN